MVGNIVERKEYLDKLIALKDKQLIKIITGVRRCGKSTMMTMFQEYLLGQGVHKNQIISINLEDMDYFELHDPMKLYTYVKERLAKGEITYVFIDEIQHCKEFPKAIDSLYIKDNIDIYLTGSNAYMLSSEIATYISGRYVEIAMLPLSFKEYVQASGNADNLSRKYMEYVQGTSFPYVLQLKEQPEVLRGYLEGIYNTIVVKDIAARKKISDTMMLESITRYVFDNIGNYLSTKKVADTMTSSGRKMDVKTVEKYLTALLESFVLYQATRYNIKGKQYLKTLEKYYVVDLGMRYMLLGTRATDVGHILENVVYLELLRRGYEVYVGKLDELEVDFVAMSPQHIVYYQVAATVRDDSTLKRELTPLQKISDHYQKFILTLDEDPEADYEGIRRVNVLDWLMDRIK